jgi:hypothetical protein
VSDSTRNLQPTLAAWRRNGSHRVAVARNETRGVSWLEGLQSYTTTRVTILEWSHHEFLPIWESRRLSGYTSAIRRFEDETWFSVVNPEESSTRLYQIPSGDDVGER